MKRLVLPLIATLLFAPSAHAAGDTAPALFKRGVALFNSGKVVEACKAFEMSDKLDDQPGTLFNMAACHERQKHYFLAHKEFARLAARMKAAGKSDKAAIARQRAADAAVHAPKLELVLPDSNNVTGIALDGNDLPADVWKQPVLVRPGAHHLTFSAKGKPTATADVTATIDQTTRVPVPVLADAHPEPKATAPAKKPGPPPGPPHSTRRTLPPAPKDHRTSSWTEQKTIGVVFAGAGVVALGVGGAFGLRALSQKSDADKACGNSNGACATATETRTAKTRIHDAQTSATISTVAITAGALGVVAGAYLFFTGNRSTEGHTARRGVHLVPAGPGDGGLSVVGAF